MEPRSRVESRSALEEKGLAKIREVRKRDSRVVPLDPTKISDAIHAAFRAVGEGDRAVAEELAAAVLHFLEGKFAGAIPGIEDIQDLVETVLIEMGHTRVAKEYILYRQKRAMMRATLEVRKVDGHQGEGITYDYGAQESLGARAKEQFLPEVDLGPKGTSSWHKSRIASALIREADLDPVIAEEIASNVEQRVLHSGVRRISTSFLRELVDNELFERGFSGKLRKQAPLGIPKYNLENLIFGTDLKEGFTFPKTPVEVRNTIANRILHQYSLEEVFTPSIADAHREGRMFIHRLSDPIRLSRLRWKIAAPLSLGGGTGKRDLALSVPEPGYYFDVRDFFGKLWHLAHFFSEEIRLVGLSNLLLDPAFKSQGPADGARAVLDRLAQMEERPGIALELDLSSESGPWLDALLAQSLTHPRRFLIAMRLFKAQSEGAGHRSPGSWSGDGSSSGAILDAIAQLYERGERIEFLPGVEAGSGDWKARPMLEAPTRLEACGAKITINLPRAAFRSARERGRSLEAELEEAVDLAVKGHLERRAFIQRIGSSRESPLWGLLRDSSGLGPDARDGIVFSIGVLGLNECVKFLSGADLHVEGSHEKSASRLGLEIVCLLERKIRREERSLGLRLELEETANVGPLRLLEKGDRSKFPDRLSEVERGRQIDWGPTYTDGVRLHRMAPVDPLRRVEDLARFLPYLRPQGGIIEHFPELRSSSRELLVSLLEECLPMMTGPGPTGS